MTTKNILIGILAMALGVGLIKLLTYSSPLRVVETTPAFTPTPTSVSMSVVTVDVVGGQYFFTSAEIKVKLGDVVKINFKNEEGLHDWVLDEFDIKTAQIKAGESEMVQFVADKKGTFEYYCSVGQHRAMGMKGNCIVE